MYVHIMYVLFAPACIYFSAERKSALVVFLDPALPDLQSSMFRQVSLDKTSFFHLCDVVAILPSSGSFCY